MVDETALMKKVGVDQWSEVDEDKAAKALLDPKNISREELSYLSSVVPNFIELARGGVVAIQAIAANKGNSQRTALENHSKIIDSYKEIAAAMESDEARLAMAGKLEEAMKINSKMNKNNNRSWLDLAKVVGTVIGVVALAAIGGRAASNRA